MAKISKAQIDKELRERVFGLLFSTGNAEGDANLAYLFPKINDRQYGTILTDANGDERYVRLGAIVAELREDMTARELMEQEIATYQEKQEAKAEKAKARAEKAEKDKEKRQKAKEAEENE